MYMQSQLMNLLVTSVGLPAVARTDNPNATLDDLGLDSLAYIQLQAEVQQRYGVRLDDSRCCAEVTVGDIVAAIGAPFRTGFLG